MEKAQKAQKVMRKNAFITWKVNFGRESFLLGSPQQVQFCPELTHLYGLGHVDDSHRIIEPTTKVGTQQIVDVISHCLLIFV